MPNYLDPSRRLSARLSFILGLLLLAGCRRESERSANSSARPHRPVAQANKPGYVQVGAVSVLFADNRLSVLTAAGESHYANLAGGGDDGYSYMLRTSRPRLDGFDGVVETNADVRAIPSNRPLTAADIPRFRFFSERPTTIGFLLGYAGNSGSRQDMILIDTESGAQVDIPVSDMCPPLWLDEQTPPSYAEMTRGPYLGCRALSLGIAPRIEETYVFRNGRYERDPRTTLRLCTDKSRWVKLTEDDMKELQKPDLVAIDRCTGVRFLDFVFYGIWSGNVKAVRNLLAHVSPAVRDETVYVLNCWVPGVVSTTGDWAWLAPTSDPKVTHLWTSRSNGPPVQVAIPDRTQMDPKCPPGPIIDWKPHALTWCRDGSWLYFMASGWETSGALWRVRPGSTKCVFVADARDYEVIQEGEYKGRLIAEKHKYFLAGGSYDWCWLMEPDGREIGPLVDDVSRVAGWMEDSNAGSPVRLGKEGAAETHRGDVTSLTPPSAR